MARALSVHLPVLPPTGVPQVQFGEPEPGIILDDVDRRESVIVPNEAVASTSRPATPDSLHNLPLFQGDSWLPLRQPSDPPSSMSGNSNAFPALDTSFNNRTASNTNSQANGAGMNNNNVPSFVAGIPVGHQQDLNYVFQIFQDLQAQLASNREKVNEITRAAEEVARRANTTSNGTSEGTDNQADKAKIRELEHKVGRLENLVDLYKHEQRENTALIAQYEDALGTATEQIRNYCNEIDTKFLTQRRHYNNMLQAEKDEHLQSRLEKDHWHAQTLELCGMLRHANRLRNDEWCDEYKVVVGLQTEVRCYRRVLGLEKQPEDEETGYPYLKDAPFNDQV